MSIISYAQNFEDVLLWRALKHVEKGFYVDIGAQDPIVDSVSLAFYKHGWRGVHVEPTRQYSELLRAARPDEIVFQLVIGSQEGTVKFYEFEDSGLSTADADFAKQHREAGFSCIETLVASISLDALFERIGSTTIHWLKLDVEGFEKIVLESWKTSPVRPWVLVIESTRPLTQQETHQEWEHLLQDKGYLNVYFDGLNRFYVSSEHDELVGAFALPPNIFDGFVLSGTASQPFGRLIQAKAEQALTQAAQALECANQAETRAAQASERANQAETRAAQASERANQAETRAAQANERANQAETRAAQANEQAAADAAAAQATWMQYQAIVNSRSWTITAPLRWTVSRTRWFVQRSVAWLSLKPGTGSGRVAEQILLHLPSRVQLRLRIKTLSLSLLSLPHRLKAWPMRLGKSGYLSRSATRSPEGVEHLSPRARQIHTRLKLAMQQRGEH